MMKVRVSIRVWLYKRMEVTGSHGTKIFSGKLVGYDDANDGNEQKLASVWSPGCK